METELGEADSACVERRGGGCERRAEGAMSGAWRERLSCVSRGERARRCAWVLLGAGVMVVLVAGCATERRVVYQERSFLAGLPNAVGGDAEASKPVARGPVNPVFQNPAGVAEAEGMRSELEGAGTSVAGAREFPETVRAATARQLLGYLLWALEDRRDEQILSQLISETTKREFADRGQPPEDIVAHLRKNQKHLRTLFSRMPLGERSPNVVMERSDRNQFRLRLTGQSKVDSHYTSLWIEFTRSGYRFVWAS